MRMYVYSCIMHKLYQKYMHDNVTHDMKNIELKNCTYMNKEGTCSSSEQKKSENN